MENKIYEYALTVYPGLSRRTKHRLLKEHTEEEILYWKGKEMEQQLTPGEWKHYLRYQTIYNIEETQSEWEQLKARGIKFIYHREKEFPEKLSEMVDKPLGIFVKGKVPMFKKAIAIVGARIPTSYGKEMASYFAKSLAKEGIDIISGLAAGIDVAAHRGALSVGGDTYGILGCGIDVVYPRENYYTYEEMAQKGGIISEYKIGEKPEAWRFPERNRIISALSDGVLIVEAKKKSGSLITADCALEQGKDVFAIPGRAMDPLSEGCNWLIREGARPVTEPSHILEELFPFCENINKEIRKSDKMLDFKEKLVYACVSLDPKSVEEIIHETNLTVSEGISILFRLELKNYIKRVDNNYYMISL